MMPSTNLTTDVSSRKREESSWSLPSLRPEGVETAGTDGEVLAREAALNVVKRATGKYSILSTDIPKRDCAFAMGKLKITCETQGQTEWNH